MSSYYLVAPFKFGLNSNLVAAFDGKRVTLKGTLIYRGSQTMIEAQPDSIKPDAFNSALQPNQAGVLAPERTEGGSAQLDRQTFVGEIVDSK